MHVIMTFGTFDLFHVGHLQLIKRAKELTPDSYLIVGVSSDEFNMKKKQTAPIIPLKQRMEIISAIKYVDEVIVEDSFEARDQAIQSRCPHAVVFGDDWEGKFDYLNEFTKVIYLPRTKDISTTDIIDQIKSA